MTCSPTSGRIVQVKFAKRTHSLSQIGDPSVQGEAGAPVLLLGPGSNQRDSGLQQPAIGIAAGARHSVVVNSLGQCITWGWSLYGEDDKGQLLKNR